MLQDRDITRITVVVSFHDDARLIRVLEDSAASVCVTSSKTRLKLHGSHFSSISYRFQRLISL